MIPSILRTAVIQAKADLRPNIIGIGIVNFLVTPILFFGIVAFLEDQMTGSREILFPATVAGIIGSYGVFMTTQIATEVFQERLNGTLLRVKTLPNGVPMWMIGRTLATGMFLFLQSAIFGTLSALVFLQEPGKIGLVIGLGLLGVIAHVPLAFLLVTLARGSWTTFVVYLLSIGLFFLSGAAFPLSILPGWVEPIAKLLPGYWTSYLSQRALLPDSAQEAFGLVPGQEWIAALAIMAWLVIGSFVAAKATAASFQKETIGSLLSSNVKLRQQMGMS